MPFSKREKRRFLKDFDNAIVGKKELIMDNRFFILSLIIIFIVGFLGCIFFTGYVAFLYYRKNMRYSDLLRENKLK